jgi:hypothetical protein
MRNVDREAYRLILCRRQSPDKAIFWAELCAILLGCKTLSKALSGRLLL